MAKRYNAIKTLCVFLAVVVFAAMAAAVPARAAADYTVALYDAESFLTAEEKDDILKRMEQAAEPSQCNLMIIISDSIVGATEREYAENMLDTNFGRGSDSVVLYLAANINANHIDWVATSGKCEKTVGKNSYKVLTKVYEELDKGGWHGAALGFCAAVEELVTGETAAEESGYKVCLSDLDGVISAAEEDALLAIMQQTANKIQCNVGAVITDDLCGKSDRQYADDFLDDSFGFGANAVVLLLNNDRSNMDYVDWISTCGRGQSLFNAHTDRIFDIVYDRLGDDNYSGAVKGFCEGLEKYASTGSQKYDDDVVFDPVSGESGFSFFTVGVCTIIALVITLIIVSVFSSGYKKKNPVSAAAYLNSEKINVTHRVDAFVREFTTKTTSSSGGSRGGGHHSGGGGHHSSSHSSHGGGGGRRR